MDRVIEAGGMQQDQNHDIAAAVGRERGRLLSFIRTRILDPGDAEDVLQEVFAELVEAYRLMQPHRAGGSLAVSGGPKPDH